MSYKYYQTTLDNAIRYRLNLLNIDKDISEHRRNSCKDDLEKISQKVWSIISSNKSDDDKVKALQQCILEMNVAQTGIP